MSLTGEQTDNGALLLEAENLSKTFAGRTVLHEASLRLRPGEIHGLVGQNGSGKSTLIKILSGYHAPDRGARLSLRGQAIRLPLHPGDPEALGMVFVHQDLALSDEGSLLENLSVGHYRARPFGRIPWKQERQAATRALRRVGLRVDLDTRVVRLSELERTAVALARAFLQIEATDAGVLVLDEPTAHISTQLATTLFRRIRSAAREGFGVIFVSHRIPEVLAFTDSVTVLRDGRVAHSGPTSDLDEQRLIAAILGFSLEDLYPAVHDSRGGTALTIRRVSGANLEPFSTEIHRGDIIGLAGLPGMGHEQVLQVLFGASRAWGGEIEIEGRRLPATSLTPERAMSLGFALLPGNRLRDGAVGTATVTENMTLPFLSRYLHHGVLRHRQERRDVLTTMGKFGVQPPRPDAAFATFSGGNQQKALLAKWLTSEPRVLLLHEPVHGVDVGAKRQIFEHIRNAALNGVAVLIVSEEHEDLAHLCDRVLVFRDGRVAAELTKDQVSAARIAEQCFSTGARIGAPPAIDGTALR